MNKNQTLLESGHWSYFSAPSYMKGLNADGKIRSLLYDDFLWPHIHMLVCNAYIWAFFVRINMHVCKKMVIYLGIKTPQSRKERKYTWQKTQVYCVERMITSIRGKKPHVYRVIILIWLILIFNFQLSSDLYFSWARFSLSGFYVVNKLHIK